MRLQAQHSDTLAYSIDIEDVVVTGQPIPLSAEDAMHEVKVIRLPELRARGFTRLSELLEREVAIGVSRDPILGTGLNIRGLGGRNVQILIDGMPVTGRLGGNVDISQIDLSEMSRVEIVSGAMSVQYGSDASGGVVNLITKKEQARKVSVSVDGQTESSGVRYASAGIGFRQNRFSIGGGINLYSTSFGEESELRARRIDTLSNGDTRMVRVTPWNPKEQLGWRANAGIRLTDELRVDYRKRGSTEITTLFGDVRRPQFRPYQIDERFETNRLDHQVMLQGNLTPKWYISATAGYNQFDRYKSTTRLDIEPDTTLEVAGGADTTRYTTQLTRLSSHFKAHERLEFTFGLEATRETAFGGRILDTATLETEPRIENYAAWAGLEFSPYDGLTLGINARAGYNTRFEHPLIPGAHLKYNITDALTLRGSYVRGFRSPDVEELFFNFIDVNHYLIGNPGLLAERSGNAQLSANYKFNLGTQETQEVLKLGLRVYHNEVENRITFFEFEPGRFRYDNIEVYTTRGGIATVEYELADRFSTSFSMGIIQLDATFAETDTIPEFVTSSEVSALLKYRLPILEVDLSLDHRFFGEQVQFVLDQNENLGQRITAPYHLLNLTASRRLWNNRLTLTTGIKDVFNNDRVDVRGAQGASSEPHGGGSSSRLIGFGRTYFVGAQFEIQ